MSKRDAVFQPRVGVVRALSPSSLSLRQTSTRAAPRRVQPGPAMRELDRWIGRATEAKSPVLILGETGTGKERVARALHERGPRASQPLRVINCAAIPDTLAEALLFGHERGAFTGANATQGGVFEQAHQGTLFLDEVGELPPRIQAMLLRVLETKRVCRIGSSREIEVDVRVVAATHRALHDMVRAGTFREDLLYRLNAITLRVPPLRERRDEIVPLALELLSEVGREWSGAASEFAGEAVRALVAYDWPGNVRELRNVIERALLLCRGDTIELSDLALAGCAANSNPPAQPEIACAPDAELSTRSRTFRERVREFEIELIERALECSAGNQRAASRVLRIPLRTLAHKIKAYGLRPLANEPDEPAPAFPGTAEREIVTRSRADAPGTPRTSARSPRLAAR